MEVSAKVGRVVEIVRYKAKQDVSDDALESASTKMESEFASRRPGFLRRTLARGEGREWLDVIYWEELELAEQAAAAAMQSAACGPFFAMIDESSIEMQHYEVRSDH